MFVGELLNLHRSSDRKDRTRTMIGDQILNTFVETFAKEHEITHAPPDEQFEHFANYAVLSRLYHGTVELEALETDGAFGIDGVAVIVNDVLATSRDEVEDLARHSLDASFMFVQTKTSASFDVGDILKFISGVDDFFVDPPAIQPNARMEALREIRKAVFDNSIKMDAAPTCELYYVCTGRWYTDATIVNLVEREKEQLVTRHGFGEVRFIPVDLEKLKGYFRSIKQRVVKQFTFEKRVVIPRIDGVNQAYIGVIRATEFLKLIMDQDHNLERGLFYENVRDYLGDNAVNLEIAAAIRTPKSTQEQFVLLNNGVTIVARSIVPTGGDDMTLRDYQVVNGCQTSHVLFYNKHELTDSLYLPLKLIATDGQELTNLIIKATNRQTEVKDEAFIALDPFQKRLEEFYSSITIQDQKLYYERRSKQYEADSTPKSRVVTISAQTNCFVAMYLEEPHSTHRYYGNLLDAYWKQKKVMFQHEHDLAPYYLSAYAMFLIDRQFRDGRIQSNMSIFRYHLLFLLRLLIPNGANFSLEVGTKKTKEFCKRLSDTISDDSAVEQAMNKAQLIIADVLANSQFTIREAIRSREFTLGLRSALTNTSATRPRSIAQKRPNNLDGMDPAPKVRGTVKRLLSDFGFIIDQDGYDVFFHRSEWKGDGELQVGAVVLFTRRLGYKGYRAFDVTTF